MKSSVHIDYKNKDILLLGKGLSQRLGDTTLTVEEKYSINLSRSYKIFCLSLHYNGSNNFLFINTTKIYQFKAKDSEINIYPLCLGNISGDFSANNMKNTGSNVFVYNFSVDFRTFNTSNIMDIHQYLMKKHKIK